MATTTVTPLGGDPAAIRGSAGRWRAFGVAAAAASVGVTVQAAMATDFVGDEGEIFQNRLADLAAGLSLAGDAWNQVGDALATFAGELEDCQGELRTLARSAGDAPADPAPADDASERTSDNTEAEQEAAQRESAVRRRTQQVRDRHDAAMRRCCTMIDRATATAPERVGTILGLRRTLAMAPGGVTATVPATGDDGIAAAAHRLRIAAATATQTSPRLGLHGGRALTTPSGDDPFTNTPDALKPGGTAWTEIFSACIASTPSQGIFDSDVERYCDAVATSVAMDPSLLPAVLQGYSGALLGPRTTTNPWATAGGVFADMGGMVADATGITDCLDGDVVGCILIAGGVAVGPVASAAGRAFRAGAKTAKGRKTAGKSGQKVAPAGNAALNAEMKEAIEAVDTAVAETVRKIRAKRVDEFREKTKPTRPDQIPVPERFLDAASGKIPEGWIVKRGRPNKDKGGKVSVRFQLRPDGRESSVRIDLGNPNLPLVSQRVDHVVVVCNGKTLNRFGDEALIAKSEEAHIPFEEWKTWTSWNHP